MTSPQTGRTVTERDQLANPRNKLFVNVRVKRVNVASKIRSKNLNMIRIVENLRSEIVFNVHELKTSLGHQPNELSVTRTSSIICLRLSSLSRALRRSSTKLFPVTKTCQRKKDGTLKAPPLYCRYPLSAYSNPYDGWYILCCNRAEADRFHPQRNE